MVAVVINTRPTGSPADGIANAMLLLGSAWVLGWLVGGRRRQLRAQVEEARLRAQLATEEAELASVAERLRIAQELHDVVAHSMSVIAVQAGVGAHLLDDRPEQARDALDAISATSRGTLKEMRRLLGVLRDDSGARSHAPAPALVDLPALVDDVRAAGVPVTLTVTGVPEGDSINAGVELSAYRVVQEALTNVIKHAGAPDRVAVRVALQSGSLAVEVVDDGRGAAAPVPVRAGHAEESSNGSANAGHGLLGMRERVELWGGELSVGPVPGGGYRVRALLPYGDDE
jgi:signal transduction histidine kinase